MIRNVLQTVLETPEFIKRAEKIADRATINDFISFIAREPQKGDLIVGTSGARKIRWETSSRQGKRGGMRVIYYYHDQSVPIFLFTAYAKNQRANISQGDKKILKTIISQIVDIYRGDSDYD